MIIVGGNSTKIGQRYFQKKKKKTKRPMRQLDTYRPMAIRHARSGMYFIDTITRLVVETYFGN